MADELTDGELRRQLLAHGQKTVGPITETTRSIYIKKLNHLKVAAKKATNSTGKDLPSRKLLGFSSDESEGESGEPAGRSRSGVGRRKTSATGRAKTKTATATPSSTLGRAPLRRRSQNVPDANVSTTSAAIHARVLPNSSSLSDYSLRADTSRTTADGLGLGRTRSTVIHKEPDPDRFDSSDSDVDVTNNSYGYDLDDTDMGYNPPEMVSRSINTSPGLDDSSLFSRALRRLSGGRRSSFGRSPGFTSPDSHLQPGNITGDSPPVSSRVTSPTDLSTTGLTNRRYPRRSNITASNPTTTIPTTVTDKQENSRTKSPHTSLAANLWQNRLRITSNNVNRQQNRLSNHSVSNHINPDSDPHLIDEEDILQHGFKTREDPASYKVSQYISMVLLALAALFFIGLAGVYVSMNTPVRVTNVPSNDNWMICPDAVSTDPGTCYSRTDVEVARKIVVEMATLLSVQAGNFECGLTDQRNLSKHETSTRLVNMGKSEIEDDPKFGHRFDVALHLAIKNPHWMIKLYDNKGDVTDDPHQVKWLESRVPHMGLLCRIQRSALKIFYYVAGLVTVALATLLVISMIRHQIRSREDETRQVYELVENIIEILRSHSESCQNNPDLQPYLAIPHVRDMLIPPKDRRKMQALWDKAVKFLSASESRIRVETQKISGEEFAVWRWLQVSQCYLEDQDAGVSKVWQGAAFGENSNHPPRSLTQCLKIRNMFDPDIECEEKWHVNIQDAILEKVSSSHGDHGIVHIAVDKTSREGCVYVKFKSPESAGKAYRALHGWWFDSNLVTVKYLRLERYHERFPDSMTCSSPLTPSNNQRRSLSQPFHRSIIESS